MKNNLFRALVWVTAAALLVACALPASALSFTVGNTVDGIGTIVTSESETIAAGLEYNKTTYTDINGLGQSLYTMEFDPAETGYMPMMYQGKPSYGTTTEKSIAAAEAAGYEVLGGINGEFGSANVENWGTLDSRMITNGRIIADSEDTEVMCLAFDNQANFQLVKSQMAYHFYIEGKEVLNAASGAPVIGCINKRYVGTNWWSPYCYFDYATGGNTYTNEDVKGVEVVFNKLNGTELTVEGILQGEVVSVNTDTYATAMTEDQFVLYAQNGSDNYAALAGLTAGQKVQIYAEELNDDAKEIMKNAVTVTAATYPIVVDGVDNSYNTPNAEDIEWTDAQRTAIGVKEDGTLVYVCVDGRGESATYNNGITLHDLADLMLSLGCKHAVNLDGGGSTTMVAGDETKLTYGRGVSSSLLIVKKTGAYADSNEKAALKALIDEATATTYPSAQQAAVNAAIVEAAAVYNDLDAATADYVRESNDLLLAMGVVQNVLPKDYISLDAADWTFDTALVEASNNGDTLMLNNKNGLWPMASYGCKMDVKAGSKLFFDVTIAGSAVFRMTVNGETKIINQYIAPNNLSGDDIVGNGQSFKGEIDLDKIAAGGFDLTGISIQVVGGAGASSRITVRQFEIRGAYENGDVDGDYQVNSNDARAVLLATAGAAELTAQQQAAADANGDGNVDTADIRTILKMSVGLL